MKHIKLILPRYDHDCSICRFVGHVGDYDCYTCDDEVLLRNGDAPEDNWMVHRIDAHHEFSAVLELEQRIVATGGFQV